MGRGVRGAVAAVAFLAATPAAAGPYRDTAHKFALDVPDGWEVVPQSDLGVLNEAGWRSGRSVAVAAFRPVGTIGLPAKGTHPLAVVSSHPSRRAEMTFAEFEKEITAVFTAPNALGSAALRGPLAFDQYRKRAVVQANDPVAGHYAAGFLWKDELLVLHCLAERRTYKDHLPTFGKLADSLRLDDPDAPAPPPPPPTFLDRTLGPLGPTGQMAAVGGAVGVVVLLAGALLRPRPKRDRFGM